MTNADKLTAALLRCTRFRLRINGRSYRTSNPIQAAEVISEHVGRRIWYRIYRGPCDDFAAQGPVY